jgi:hypothetical protein
MRARTWPRGALGPDEAEPAGQAREFGSLIKRGSEEKVALMGFPFRPAVSSEAHFLSVVSTELVTEKLPV